MDSTTEITIQTGALRNAYKALSVSEWKGSWSDSDTCCPCCKAFEDEGHDEGCELHLALKALETVAGMGPPWLNR